MREIVGARIGSRITNNLEAILKAAQQNKPMQLLSKGEMVFLAGCDLGVNWVKMAEAPVLFVQGDDGSFIFQNPPNTRIKSIFVHPLTKL